MMALYDGLKVERDVSAQMRDGVSLCADVYRPAGAGPFPVILMRTPYDKRVAQTGAYRHPAWYAQHGFMVVIQDVRGRFASHGLFDPLRNEVDDGYDAVEWAAGLSGADGNVGMYGYSYVGATQLLAAVSRPPALRCIIPGFTASDYYDGWTYKGGALNLAFVESWTVLELAMGDAVKQGKEDLTRALSAAGLKFPALYWERPLREFSPLRDTGVAPYFFDWLVHDTRDEYWQDLSLEHRYQNIEVPCLHLGGWYDIFIEGTLRNYAALSHQASGQEHRTQQVVVGPWIHTSWRRFSGEQNFGVEADGQIDDLQLRWFRHWLKGEETGVVDDPPVRLFDTGSNSWRTAASWPPSDTSVETWYLHSSGTANSSSGDGTLSVDSPEEELPDVYTYVPGVPVPSQGGASCCAPDITPMGPYDQSRVETRNDVLVYTTPALDGDLQVTGTVELILFAATDAVDTDWTGKLVDVDPQGYAVNLCDGILRARFRESLVHPTLLVPGEVYEYRIRVGSLAHRFASGHRLRLEVSSSHFPQYDMNVNTGQAIGDVTLLEAVPATNTVLHTVGHASHVLLPVQTSQSA